MTVLWSILRLTHLNDVQNGSQNANIAAKADAEVFITAGELQLKVNRVEDFDGHRNDHDHGKDC